MNVSSLAAKFWFGLGRVAFVKNADDGVDDAGDLNDDDEEGASVNACAADPTTSLKSEAFELPLPAVSANSVVVTSRNVVINVEKRRPPQSLRAAAAAAA
eukprot:CAMPEP_0167805710 /NCGR_PEP_ID=MMETSP0111_2-20121227/21360_1 /TAXON_ID=91324 /ORGANISM="Lotharella globosa, Strain CCCM811" /LENGTH=99 /DNA_ID=CAMNT_0007702955 /DNA_START=739 /DNA_END=1036 /DNA_ORIENTATION=+